MFYVYEHIRPDTNQVFYVGKGSGDRIREKRGRNSYWHNIVAKAGGFKSVKIVKTDNEELAYLAEQERIDQLKRLGYKLANLNAGGLGGIIASEKTKQKMSKSHSGEKNARFNVNSLRQKRLRGELKVPKEVMSANMKANHWSKTGTYFPPKGIKRSEETKKKMRGKRPNYSGLNNPNAKKLIYDNQEFTVKSLAEFFNVNYGTFRVKIRTVKRTVFTKEDFNSLTNGRIAFN